MWKYSNPGDYQLLDAHNGRTYANIEDSAKAPQTGIAYTTQSQEDGPITVPDGTKEIYLKMDVYVKDRATILIQSRTTAYAVAAKLEQTGWILSAGYRGYDFANQRFTLKEDTREGNLDLDGKVVTLELRVRSRLLNESSSMNGADGCVEMRINHKIMAKIENVAIFNGEDIKIDSITSNFGYSYFSNIIVSDEPVQGRENVFVLPIKEITLDGWTQERVDGNIVEYKATGINQNITQNFDVDAVREVLGENVNITSINFKTLETSTDNPEEVDALTTSLVINGSEAYSKTNLIDGSTTDDAITVNPVTNQAWTLSDLETTELVIRTDKSES